MFILCLIITRLHRTISCKLLWYFINVLQVFALGVTPDTNYKTAMSEYMSPDNKAKWLAERAFVALFVATHRGHQSLCQKLISSGM